VYRFALRGRWLLGHIIVLAMAGLFVVLGFWQLDRLDQVRASNTLIEARRSLPVVDLEGLVQPSDPRGGQATQRRVVVSGRYDPSVRIVSDFRSIDGTPGVDVLTPLLLDDGAAVIVDRGWVPAATPESGISSAASAPQGMVEVTGFALEGVPPGSGRAARADGTLQLTRIDLGLLQREIDYDLYPVYVRLQTQQPAQSSGLPRVVPPPALDEGPHLSYAIQWFVFATIGLIGWPLLLRHAAWERRANGPARRPAPTRG
jgi:cytochrome oxidase assembly protein ShyY1